MNVDKSVIELKEKHCKTWRDKSQWYWAMGLLEEVVELIGALLGFHKGPVEWELMQISAICMNWIELRNPQSLPTPHALDGVSPTAHGVYPGHEVGCVCLLCEASAPQVM